MSERNYNFNAGPAVLPEQVIETARDNLLNYQESGIGILEMSHRSADFKAIIQTAEEDLRGLVGIGDDYAVIFATGGASSQFSMVPMNLLSPGLAADYIISGSWAKKALTEAKKFGEAREAGNSQEQNHTVIPRQLSLSDDPAYVHFTSNNTIAGTQFHTEPEVGDRVLVCDASSDILSRKFDITKYGLIYAGAQKNLGPAGVTLVIIRKDLLERSQDSIPVMMNYNTYVNSGSLYNTPPAFPIYVLGLVLKWLKKCGGLSAIEERNRQKAGLLYNAIDSSDSYKAVVSDKDSRSYMNVCFRLTDTEREPEFIEKAKSKGFVGLAGHRSVGGLRASIYNALPEKAVSELVSFMEEFAG